MEEKKNQPQKLSYEELNEAASNLHAQYQKLMVEYQKAINELNRVSFEGVGFLISMLFKVLENEKRFDYDFIKWSAERIKTGLLTYDQILQEQVPAETEEKKDEAE